MVRLALTLAFPHALLSAPARAVKAMGTTLVLWGHRARQRRHLARLDDALLKDVGLTRCDAENEAAKPFWKE